MRGTEFVANLLDFDNTLLIYIISAFINKNYFLKDDYFGFEKPSIIKLFYSKPWSISLFEKDLKEDLKKFKGNAE